ncbi:MAG: hypothetical protein H6709_02855 [Kofleriaceae bacterium]|nr:hypothetical protein [Myxococcales bacterium]MCB9562688.1 hypothetical protein [Kofleriaceae bacterium]MCB9571007.1 hypothetical protein [Kofleriaceae bacterium]
MWGPYRTPPEPPPAAPAPIDNEQAILYLVLAICGLTRLAVAVADAERFGAGPTVALILTLVGVIGLVPERHRWS